jgi:uncharacterized membrane protein
MTILDLEIFFVVGAAFLGVVALRAALDATHPTRLRSAAFWATLALLFGAGRWLPPAAVGYLVLGAVALSALRLRRASAAPADQGSRRAEASRLGNRLFVPALVVPAIVIALSFALPPLADRVRVLGLSLAKAAQASQVALGVAALAAFGVALRVTGARVPDARDEAARLFDVLGWTLLLPQVLAAMGGVLARAGVGDSIARVAGEVLPMHIAPVAVLAYCATTTLLTILMGNAFAAFPVATLGLGLPFVARMHGADPAMVGALGMLSGYCGTLVTPMAANFNLVPALLLDLPGSRPILRAQAPFAAAIWAFAAGLMIAVTVW